MLYMMAMIIKADILLCLFFASLFIKLFNLFLKHQLALCAIQKIFLS